MKCPKCNHDSRPLAKFCEQCGAPLMRACRNCAAALPERARFCPECGHTAEAAPNVAQSAPESAREAGGDRRHATVLFADISGYTQLCAKIDAEQVQALLNRFYALTDGIVVAYGGSVIDHAGDGVLAAFGAPVAHGNDPERAVRAAFDMHAAVGELEDPSGETLKLHIGIASGEVVAAVISGGITPKFSVTGDTVNLAARVNALGGSGDTLVSHSVYRSVAALTDAEDLGEHALKGFDSPIRVMRILHLRASAPNLLPFVGRETELKQLASVLDGVRETSRGVAVAIRGEAGMGKSRLVQELIWRAESQGYAYHIGRVLDFGVAKGQDALSVVVGALLGIAGNAPAPAKVAALMQAIEDGRISAQDDVLLRDLLNLDQPAPGHRIFDAMDNAARTRRTAEAVSALVKQAAATQPRLVVFEDIHWGAPLLHACLAALALATRQSAVVLAMTTRFEGDPLDRQWRAASRGTPLLSIDLGPLLPEQAHQLAGDLMESSERFARQCIERADGNPLFLEQLLRNARESQGTSLPPTIQSLVLSRMDRLSARDKLALQAASVIGKRFTLDLLQLLIDDPGYTCDAIVAVDLVRPEGADFLFAHALIQEGVYSSLLNSRKRELHGKAAQWYGTREPVLRAKHLDRAQDARAVQAYFEAAQAEAKLLHFDAALELTERGGELAGDGPVASALCVLQGHVLLQMGRTQASIAAFDRALQFAGDDAQRCRAWLGMAAGYRVTGEAALAMQALDHAQPVAERLQLAEQCSRIHSTRGNLHFAHGKVEVCRLEHERALDYARQANDPECQAIALSGLADSAYAAGRMHTALDYFTRCLELARQADLVRVEIPNRCMLGHCLVWTGHPAAGIAEIRSSIELSDRIGVTLSQVMTYESMGFALVLQGHFAQAQTWLEQAMTLSQHVGARRYLATNLMLLAACHSAEGRLREARECILEAQKLSEEIGIGFLGPSIQGALANASEDPDERERRLAEGEAVLTQDCLAPSRLMFYEDAIDLTLRTGDWQRALRYADELEEYIRPQPFAFAELMVARSRMLCAYGRGERSAHLAGELAQLRDRIKQAGFLGMLREVERALAGVQAA